jgi:hypothetical protein
MAQSLDTLRNSRVLSIHGRRLGIDKDEFLVGPKPLKELVEDLTTASTGTTVANHGVARVLTSGSTQGPVQYVLEAPAPGVRKTLLLGSSSTGSHQFLSTPNGASIRNSSAGTTSSLVNLLSPGAAVVLIGVTTAQWQVESEGGLLSTNVTKNFSFTTST